MSVITRHFNGRRGAPVSWCMVATILAMSCSLPTQPPIPPVENSDTNEAEPQAPVTPTPSTPDVPAVNERVVTTADGMVRLEIPANATASTTTFVLDPTVQHAADPRLVTGTVCELGPSDMALTEPVRLEIHYDPAALPEQATESELSMYELLDGAWNKVANSVVDTVNHHVSALVDHVGTYAVMVLANGSPEQLAVALTASASSVRSGSVVTIAASVTGGTLPYSYDWDPKWAQAEMADPVAFYEGRDSATLSATLHSAGRYEIKLTVRDGNDMASNATIAVDVVADIAATTMPVSCLAMLEEYGSTRITVPDWPGLNGYAYITQGMGIKTIDVSRPESPALLHHYYPAIYGPFSNVCISGYYAYVINDNTLEVLDIRRPLYPLHVTTLTLDGRCNDLAVSGAYAYATHTHGVDVIELRDPCSPIHVYTIELDNQLAQRIVTQGAYAYVAAAVWGIRVLDISNPITAREVATIESRGDQIECHDVAVSGRYLYAANGWARGLEIYDVSDPTAPMFVSAWRPSGIIDGVAVDGDYAVITLIDWPGNLGSVISDPYSVYARAEVIDISDPANPRGVGVYQIDPPSQFQDVALVDRTIYLTGSSLHVLRIEDGQLAVEAAAAPGTIHCGESTILTPDVTGGTPPYRYEWSDSSGWSSTTTSPPVQPSTSTIYTLEVRDAVGHVQSDSVHVRVLPPRVRLEQVGHVVTGSYAIDVAIKDGYAYVADGDYDDQALQVIDVRNPASPEFKANITIDAGIAYAKQIALSNSRVYVRYGRRLGLFRIYQPTTVIPVTEFRAAGGLEGLSLAGDTVFTSSDVEGLMVIEPDISDDLRQVGTLASVNGTVRATLGDYAYVSDRKTVRIIDVSDYSSMRQVSSYDTDTDAMGLDLMGHHLCVAIWSGGLEIVDVSDPATPMRTAEYDDDDSGISRVVISGSRAFLLDPNGLRTTMTVLDLSDPSRPIRVGGLDSVGRTSNFTISDGHLYLAAGDNGLFIFRIESP